MFLPSLCCKVPPEIGGTLQHRGQRQNQPSLLSGYYLGRTWMLCVSTCPGEDLLGCSAGGLMGTAGSLPCRGPQRACLEGFKICHFWGEAERLAQAGQGLPSPVSWGTALLLGSPDHLLCYVMEVAVDPGRDGAELAPVPARLPLPWGSLMLPTQTRKGNLL